MPSNLETLAGVFHDRPPDKVPRRVLIVGVHSDARPNIVFEVCDDDEHKYLIRILSTDMLRRLGRFAGENGFRDNEDLIGSSMVLRECRGKTQRWWVWEYRLGH